MAKVSRLINTSYQQYHKGNIIDESEAYECKTTYEFMRPNCCIVMYEISENIYMKGSGHA